MVHPGGGQHHRSPRRVHLAPVEISWFFFSIGVVFWIVLLAVVMYRLFFHAPLALRLTPTLFILLAPPSVGFVAWSGLVGGLDAFGRVLYYTALFLALLLVSNAMPSSSCPSSCRHGPTRSHWPP
jgi:tellurite resistance protein